MSCEGCGALPLCGDHEGRSGDAGGLNRRKFIERSTLAAIGALLAGCTQPIGGPLAPSAPSGGPYTVKVTDYPALANVGGVARVSVGGGAIGVGRVSATDFAAYGLACTHQGTQVQVNGDGWYCPNHGAEYNTAGKVIRGPAVAPLVSVPVSFDSTTNVLTVNDLAPSQGTVGGDEEAGDDDGSGDP